MKLAMVEESAMEAVPEIEETEESWTEERRRKYVGGLRQLADAIERLELPEGISLFGTPRVYVGVSKTEAPKDELVKARRAIGGTASKKVDGRDLELLWTFQDLCELQVFASREEVCTKRVVGTRTVKKKVWPDVKPAEVEVEEEVVEWDCSPLLEDVNDG